MEIECNLIIIKDAPFQLDEMNINQEYNYSAKTNIYKKNY